MSIVKRIAKNSIIGIVGEVVNKLFALLLTIILARYLGDLGFGQYSFVIAAIMVFQVLSDFGLDVLTIRETSKNLDKTGLYLSNFLLLKLGISLASCIILALIINATKKPVIVIYSVYVGSLSLIFYSIANTFNAIFNAYEKLAVKALTTVSSKILLVAITLLAVFLKKDLFFIILAVLISEIFRAILSWVICDKKVVNVKFEYDPILCRRLLKTSFSFALIGIIALIYFKIDIFMLSFMKGDQAVGWYSAAYGLLAALIFITEAYNLSIFPAFSRYAISAKDLLAFGWNRSIKYLFIISAPIAFGTTILADRFITLFYSASYSNSIIALRILIWTLPWIFVNSINVKVLYATDNQNSLTPVVIFSAVVNVVLNLLLIPSLSYVGASFATLIAEIINVFVCFWIVKKLTSFRFDIKNLVKPLIASMAMSSLLYYFRNLNLVILLLLGIISYFAALLLIGSLDEQDKELIRRLIPNDGKRS